MAGSLCRAALRAAVLATLACATPRPSAPTGDTLEVVSRVVDADELALVRGERVRLIGVVPIHTKQPQPGVEWSGREGSAPATALLEGKRVRLEYDDQARRDRSGKIRAYVFLEDGTFVNAEMIRQGQGQASTGYPFRYLEEFRALQREAMENGRGRWMPDPETRAEIEKVPLIRALGKADPAVHERAVRALYQGYLQGQPFMEVGAVVRALVEPVFLRSLPDASDEVVLRYGDWILSAVAELQDAPGQLCLSFAGANTSARPSDGAQAYAYLTPSLRARTLSLMIDVIESAAPGRPRANLERGDARVLEHASELIGGEFLEDILALHGDPSSVDPARACRTMFGLLSGLMSLPPKDAASLLRAFFAEAIDP